MKTRIITAIFASAAMLVVLFLPWSIVFTVAVSAICGIAVYEVLSVTKTVQHRGLKVASILFAVLAPFFSRMPSAAVFVVCLVYVLMLIVLYILYSKGVTVEQLGGVFLLSVLIALSLSCASYLRTASSRADSDGLFYVILAMVIAWLADSGAYFVGTFLGKHKLCPRISPKKTVEGLIGGIVCSVLFSLLVGWIYQTWILGEAAAVSYWTILGLSLVCAPLSVIGDLFASIIKRHCGVKDFGKIFPGHGGMLDRFDSLLFVFPVVYFTVRYLPIIY
ncbi:MAG: phosphatidate cytidylyltransferase [Clostridia bacterium]|nr:phosphatidate cytidylyltransferase [Clostridia bacterium]